MPVCFRLFTCTHRLVRKGPRRTVYFHSSSSFTTRSDTSCSTAQPRRTSPSPSKFCPWTSRRRLPPNFTCRTCSRQRSGPCSSTQAPLSTGSLRSSTRPTSCRRRGSSGPRSKFLASRTASLTFTSTRLPTCFWPTFCTLCRGHSKATPFPCTSRGSTYPVRFSKSQSVVLVRPRLCRLPTYTRPIKLQPESTGQVDHGRALIFRRLDWWNWCSTARPKYNDHPVCLLRPTTSRFRGPICFVGGSTTRRWLLPCTSSCASALCLRECLLSEWDCPAPSDCSPNPLFSAGTGSPVSTTTTRSAALSPGRRQWTWAARLVFWCRSRYRTLCFPSKSDPRW